MNSNDVIQHEDVKINHMEIKLKINMIIHLKSPSGMVTIVNIWKTNILVVQQTYLQSQRLINTFK
jgi:hypothetical protein